MKDLASQAGNMQMMIMRVPEIMCPKNGTNMIGFLPESEKIHDDHLMAVLQIENLCSPERGPIYRETNIEGMSSM